MKVQQRRIETSKTVLRISILHVLHPASHARLNYESSENWRWWTPAIAVPIGRVLLQTEFLFSWITSFEEFCFLVCMFLDISKWHQPRTCLQLALHDHDSVSPHALWLLTSTSDSKASSALCHIREKLTVATQAECTQHAMVSPPSHCETGQWLLLSGMWREKIRKDLLHSINR